MSIDQIRSDVYDYVYCQGRSTLDEIIEAIDADANSVYGACKHLKWDDYLEADTGNNEWWLSDKDIPGLCPECNAEAEYGDVIQLECPDCGWEETWTCNRCGDEEHDAIEFNEVEIDVTCQSVYITPTDGGNGFAFTHSEFCGIMEHFNESEYTAEDLSR